MVTNVTGIATDFITFSRASNATVTNNVGLIAWAPHNFLLASEQLDATNWFKGGITISANSAVAPNGTTTADTCTTTTTTPAIYYAIAAPASTLTYSIYVKTGAGVTKPTLEFLMRNNSTSTNFDTGTFDTVTGAITGTGWTSTAVGSGWYLVSYTRSTGITEGNTLYVYAGWTGATTSIGQTWVIWGAAIYRSDSAGMQPNASTNPAFSYYNSTTPKNLLGYTEDFSNAYWAKVASTVISNIIPAPNGLMSADKIVASSAASTWHVVRVLNAFGSGPTTISVYAKAAEYSLFRVADYDNGVYYASFDLVNGTVISGTTGGTKYVSASITFAGDGWYRCSVVVDAVSASRAVGFGGYPSGATLDNFGAKFTGNDISGVYIWGAQLSDSASIDAYSPNYFAAPSSAAYYGPRRDFSPTTLACNGLLVEEQRTNLLLHSAAFDNAAWSKNVVTVTAKNVSSPDGQSNGDTITATAGTGAHHIGQTATVSASTAYMLSFYVKAGTHNFIQVMNSGDGQAYANINIATGVVGNTGTKTTATATPVGNGWYRCAVSFSSTATFSNSHRLYFAASLLSGYAPTFTAVGTETVLLYGAQLEAGSFATSYIPTSASTVTRSADITTVSLASIPYSSSEGAVVASVTPYGVNDDYNVWAITDGGNNNRMNSQAGPVQHFRSSVAGTQTVLLDAGTFVAGTTTKIGAAFAAGNYAAVINAGTPATSSAASGLPVVDRFGLGNLNGSGQLNGWVRQITYIPRRISNTDLQTRTAT